MRAYASCDGRYDGVTRAAVAYEWGNGNGLAQPPRRTRPVAFRPLIPLPKPCMTEALVRVVGRAAASEHSHDNIDDPAV
jgi:hypothetical protein